MRNELTIDDRLIEASREAWNERARSDPWYASATGTDPWTEETFFASGRRHVADQILTDMTNICAGRNPKVMQVLEIGCGAGRVTRALADLFGTVFAVDISREMVASARKSLVDYPNAFALENDGATVHALDRFVADGSLDFAFSSLTFQHVASLDVIESYVREVHRLLRPGALFKFTVQGSLDAFPSLDDTWQGMPVTAEDAEGIADRAGFELRHSAGAETQRYWLWFFKKT